MTVRFYRTTGRGSAQDIGEPGGLSLLRWRPRYDGPPQGIFASRTNWAWWLMDRLGMFARADLAIYGIHDGQRLLHRLLVTPRWYRFPFMGKDDLQLGMLWTAPEMRGRGLARLAIAAVHRDYADSFGAIWYLVEEGNTSSIRLIEGCGYELVGRGKRTRLFGLSLLGRYWPDGAVAK